ncbi:hypothetical protein JCM3774_002319 [Rhodotorula dairenensis]
MIETKPPAVYGLSSLAPSARPKQANNLPELAELKRKSAAVTEPLSRISAAVAPVLKVEPKRAPQERRPALALSTLRPPPPAVSRTSQDAGGTKDLGVDEWSPKKRKGGYLASGMAARASSILSAARTEQTLWLHDFSRRLAAVAGRPAQVPVLADELRPDLKVEVLEVLSFGSDEADSFMAPDRRRERRSTLAMCRLVRDRVAHERSVSASTQPQPQPQPTRETQGLVLFSLQDRFGQHSTTAGAAPTIPSPPKRSRTDHLVPAALSAVSSSSMMTRTVAVPTVPPDLRSIRPGVEVWVWEPFHEAVLLGADDVHFDEVAVPTLSEEGEVTPTPVGGFSVGWQTGPANKETEPGADAVVRKALSASHALLNPFRTMSGSADSAGSSPEAGVAAPIALRVPPELWVQVSEKLKYADLKRLAGVCRAFKAIVEHSRYRLRLFRKPPTGALQPGRYLAIHPLLEEPQLVFCEDVDNAEIYRGEGDSLNAFDYPAADETATAPACNKLKIVMHQRKCGSVSCATGVTVRQVLKRAIEYWTKPVTGALADRVQSDVVTVELVSRWFGS